MTIDIEKNKLIITFRYDPLLVEIIKTFPDRKFITKTKNWSVPIIHVKDVLDTLLPLHFVTSAQVNKEYITRVKYLNKIFRIKEGKLKTSELTILTNTCLPLYDYQKIGAGFLCTVGSGLLGDEPGTGKSITSLAMTIIKKSKKNLIICPSSIKRTWVEEIKKWIPSAKIYLVEGSKINRDEIYKKAQQETNVFYLILNYELLLRDSAELNKF